MAGARVATAADASGIANTLALAFQGDPLWAWAFPDPALRYRQLETWWRFFVDNALHHSGTWTTPAYEAAAVWIPPGGAELSDVAQAEVEPLLSRLLHGRHQGTLELLEQFERAHPSEPPHYYLSLVGTHPDHRGQGIGMALLAQTLEAIDREHAPAYLESSNPANNRRYEGLGFRQVGAFAAPGGPSVVTMWRDPQGMARVLPLG
ncbi:MAG TPA: GNAT family N-acetyltransferase [Candidatus Dormibacteraeota bacterium]|nr:GNAT family N-acetyltransferase [Candidatus Dormibacteraeota bacterium]